jgi:hypothetical protein
MTDALSFNFCATAPSCMEWRYHIINTKIYILDSLNGRSLHLVVYESELQRLKKSVEYGVL